jgi:hypothetical protein
VDLDYNAMAAALTLSSARKLARLKSMRSSVQFASFASLAFAVAQLALPGRASVSEVSSVAGVEAPAPCRHEAKPPTCYVRTCLAERPADRLVEAPFAPAELVSPDASWVAVPAPAAGTSEAVPDALVILPPSRAPPAHS